MSGLNQIEATVQKPPLKILLAAPRGFCAGVDRAIQIVEQALTKFGAPVYVRHEIVHNRYVVDSLRAKGAVFVKELDEIPDTSQPVIFSAHGVSKAIPEAARGRNMFVVDATCPLVSKVHMETARHHEQGREIILVGHRGHPEVVGTLGQLPEGAITLVESVEDVRAFTPKDPENLAFVTQTTLSLDDTAEIVAVLKERFPGIGGPVKEDICYATTNRQNAVKALAPQIDGLIVVGGPKSSNSLRLVEVAERAGCRFSFLVERATDIPWEKLDGAATIGITAGASAPEVIVEEVVEAFRSRYDVTIDVVTTLEERVIFKVPREVRVARAPVGQQQH
ncbi:4-hydroxy-3-methylbut-2-enyl diphosphate reductase [Hyphomicrobium sp. 2TAF46]|uniref:4-hydroxy-3-methylbut-2-enyl diphosphate reductase n=1 Tax=Hyphomicrobium sp. 2TAF46 TaxID=3233019 RepID=UPI003F914873